MYSAWCRAACIENQPVITAVKVGSCSSRQLTKVCDPDFILPFSSYMCSSSERGADFKEVQGPKSSRSSDTTYHAPGLELTNKFSVLDEN